MPTMLIIYIDEEESDECGGTIVPRQLPRTEYEPSGTESEPPSSEAEEEAEACVRLSLLSQQTKSSFLHQPRTPFPIHDPDEQTSRH